MKNHSVLIASALLAGALVTAAPALANDRYTGLAVAPGVRDNDPVTSSALCPGANHVHLSLYLWQGGTPAVSIAAWYKNALPASSATTMNIKGVKEYVVTNSTSRIMIFDYMGRTTLKLEHADRPIDFTHALGTCTDTS